MKELLEQLGFENITGNLWKSEITGFIQINIDDTPDSIVQKIYDRGYGECQEIIKSTLGIKP